MARSRPRRGWHIPWGSVAGHYFHQGESLCGNHVLESNATCYDSDVELKEYDCRLCIKLLGRLRTEELVDAL